MKVLFLWIKLLLCWTSYIDGSFVALLSSEKGICHVRENVAGTLEIFNTDIAPPSSKPVALARDQHQNVLFWSDLSENYRGIWRKKEERKRIVKYEDMRVYGIDVDWIGKVLYWTDTEYRMVRAANYDGKYIVDVTARHLVNPRAITVDAVNRAFYVGDQGSHHVMRCKLDGSDCSLYEEEFLPWPNQIFMDYSNQKVHIVDGWSPQILSCTLDFAVCNKTFVKLQNVSQNLFGISLLGNKMVVTTFQGPTLYFVDEPKSSVVLRSGNENFFYIHVSSNESQPMSESPCRNDNRCPQLCFPKENDGVVCISESPRDSNLQGEVLLYLDRERSIVGITTTDLSRFRLSILANSRAAYALAYDPESKNVYFSDILDKAIYVVGIANGQKEVFMTKADGLNDVIGLAFDELQRRLYYINRIDSNYSCVEMTTLNRRKRRKILCSEDNVNTIYIDQRYLFVATESYLSRFKLDGFGEVSKQFQSRVSKLSFTVNNGDIRIAVSAHSTESYDFSGLNQIPTNQGGYFPLIHVRYRNSSTANYIGDPNTKRICKKVTNNARGCFNIPVRTDQLVFVDLNTKVKEDQGLCADNICGDKAICFRGSDPSSVSCQCPSYDAVVLADDRKTCKPPVHYALLATSEGLRIAPIKAPDTSSINIVAPDVGQIYGLTTGNNGRIYFTDGKTIFTTEINNPTKIDVLVTHYTHTISELAYSDKKVFWIGFNSGLTRNTSGMAGIFYKAVDGGDVTEIVANISSPRNLIVNPSYIYWSENGNKLKYYDRIGTTISIRAVTDDIRVTCLNDKGRTMYVANGRREVSLINLVDWSVIGAITIDMKEPCGMEAAGHFLYIMDCGRKQLFSYNMRTKQQKLIAVNVFGAGQLVTFGVDTGEFNQEKPGICGKVDVTRWSSKTECSSDYDCIDAAESKCCYQDDCQVCTAIEDDGICQLNVNNTMLIWAEGEEFISSDCKECSCSNPQCSTIKCPKIDCHGNEMEKVPGECCAICSSFTNCKEKPHFKNCPKEAIEAHLPDMGNATDSYASVTIERDHPNLRGIIALSCAGTVLRWEMEKSLFTWQQNIQYVKLTARDGDLESLPCQIPLKIIDDTDPLFVSFPADARAIANSTEGAMVRWAQPEVYDNSGHVQLRLEHTNKDIGDTFPVNYTKVTYIAWDGANNGIRKSFTVYVEILKSKCEAPPSIANGFMDCAKKSGVSTCEIRCFGDSILNTADYSATYECGKDGKYTPPITSDIGGACFKPQPKLVALAMSTTFDCDDLSFTSLNALECLHDINLCPKSGSGMELCDDRHLNITHEGKTTTLSVRIEGKLRYGLSERNENNFIESMKTKAKTIINFFKSTKQAKTYCPNIGCSFKSGFVDENTKFSCPRGSVKHVMNGKLFCGKCSQGTWFEDGKCHPCASGWYQEKEGQFNCTKCQPPNVLSPVGSWMKRSCQRPNKLITAAPPSTSMVPVYIVVSCVVVMLVLIVMVVVCLRRRNKRTLNDKLSAGHGLTSLSVNNQVYLQENPSDAYDEIPADSNPYDAIGDLDRGACAAADCASADPYSCLIKAPDEDDDYEKLNGKKNKCLDEETSDAYTCIGKDVEPMNPYDDLKLDKK